MSLVFYEPFELVGRFADQNHWEVLNGPGDGRVTGAQFLEDEGVKVQWTDKVVLATGVSTGIGIKTFEAMAATGTTVFGTARNLEKARDALGAAVLENGRCHLLYTNYTEIMAYFKVYGWLAFITIGSSSRRGQKRSTLEKRLGTSLRAKND